MLNKNTGVSLLRQRTYHIRTAETFRAFARWAGVERDVVDGAIDNFRAGSIVALLGSGAQGSGKDTVCPAVLEAMGITTSVQCRVAHGIRAEMSDIISLIERSTTRESAVGDICRAFNVSIESGSLYTELFFEATRDSAHAVHVHERTERMRRALQWHGAEGRAGQPGYWVKRTYQDVIPHLAEGRSVYLTDGRFHGEVDAGRTSGALCIRLWVPTDVRVARISERDGITPSVETLTHSGEIALDGYWGLDAEIDNTGSLDTTVSVIADMLDEHRTTMKSL